MTSTTSLIIVLYFSRQIHVNSGLHMCLLQATFRILAYTDCKIQKVGQLQLMIMNLQIDAIRSLSFFTNDISLVLASPRMKKIFVETSDEMRKVRKELIMVC